jgi:hypothetical protein
LWAPEGKQHWKTLRSIAIFEICGSAGVRYLWAREGKKHWKTLSYIYILIYLGVLEWDICELRRAKIIEKPHVLRLFWDMWECWSEISVSSGGQQTLKNLTFYDYFEICGSAGVGYVWAPELTNIPLQHSHISQNSHKT